MKANRALFKKYLNTTKHKDKHRIEKTFGHDPFVMDALEGFQSHENSWEQFRAMDKKHHGKKRYRSLYLFIIILPLSLTVGWILRPNQEVKTNSNEKLKLHAKNNLKIHGKAEIFQMTPVAVNKRITPKEIINASPPNTKIDLDKPNQISKMELIAPNVIDLNKNAPKQIILKVGKEMYIKNFKVLDYRYYIKENEISGIQLDETDFGDKVIKIPYINLLSRAIEDFSNENYKLALLHFDEILQVYQDDANALFYGAMCLYNLNEFEQAQIRFLKLQKNIFSNFREEANWYLLRVYKQTKQKSAFNQLRMLIIENNGFYAKKALEINLE